MQAVVIDNFNEAGAVRELPEPTLEPDAVLVRVTAAGVNPIDWKVRAGEAGERSFPLVLGQDFAGVVERAGDRVRTLKRGDRVFGCAREHGSYASLTLVPEDSHDSPIAHIPDRLSDTVAAALPTPGLTALASLDALGVERDVPVLILGAAGAVGSIAVQIARNRGALVTAVVKPGQAAKAREDGAVEVVETGGDALESIRSLHPEPFPAVLDLVNDREQIEKNESLYAKGGRFVTTIHVADEKWFEARGVTAYNLVMNRTPESSSEGLRTLAETVLHGGLRIDVEPEKMLTDAAAVLDGMQHGTLPGKYVLRTAP